MKKILFILFIFCKTFVFSQEKNYAIVEFLPYTYLPTHGIIDQVKAQSYKIYMNGKLISTFKGTSRSLVKMYSKGTINILILYGAARKKEVIDITENKKYYFVVGLTKTTSFSLISTSEAIQIKKNWGYLNTVKFLENINNPIASLDQIASPSSSTVGTVNKTINKRLERASAFLINKEGYLVTNFQVVDGARQITLRGVGGNFSTEVKPKVVAVDRQLDLALLKVDPVYVKVGVPPYSFKTSRSIKKSSPFYGLGYPVRNPPSDGIKLIRGVVNSSKGQKHSISEFFLSHSIPEGNNGGPLFDRFGNVVGVMIAPIHPNAQQNVGFAIKSDYITFFLDQIGNVSYKRQYEPPNQVDLRSMFKEFSKYVYIVETKR